MKIDNRLDCPHEHAAFGPCQRLTFQQLYLHSSVFPNEHRTNDDAERATQSIPHENASCRHFRYSYSKNRKLLARVNYRKHMLPDMVSQAFDKIEHQTADRSSVKLFSLFSVHGRIFHQLLSLMFPHASNFRFRVHWPPAHLVYHLCLLVFSSVFFALHHLTFHPTIALFSATSSVSQPQS